MFKFLGIVTFLESFPAATRLQREGPEHKKIDMLLTGHLFGGVGTLVKEIRVPLPSCVVRCIRAHFPPPGLEKDLVYEGFKFADE